MHPSMWRVGEKENLVRRSFSNHLEVATEALSGKE